MIQLFALFPISSFMSCNRYASVLGTLFCFSFPPSVTLPFFLIKFQVFHFLSISVFVIFLILPLIPSSRHSGSCPPFLLLGLVSNSCPPRVLLCVSRVSSQTLIRVLLSSHKFSLLSVYKEAGNYRLYREAGSFPLSS